jgi:hypothetical protein
MWHQSCLPVLIRDGCIITSGHSPSCTGVRSCDEVSHYIPMIGRSSHTCLSSLLIITHIPPCIITSTSAGPVQAALLLLLLLPRVIITHVLYCNVIVGYIACLYK